MLYSKGKKDEVFHTEVSINLMNITLSKRNRVDTNEYTLICLHLYQVKTKKKTHLMYTVRSQDNGLLWGGSDRECKGEIEGWR